MLSVSTQFTPTDSHEKFIKMLQSVAFADEIVVFVYQNTSTDFLAKLSKKYPLRLIKISSPKIVELIRSRQVREAKGDWVLILDFDEIVSPKLRGEILDVIKNEPAVFAVRRLNFSLGYPLRYGGWGNDNVIRLFPRQSFIDWPTNIHSTPLFKGELKKLKNYLEHHKDDSLEYIVNKTNLYSSVEAQQFYDGHLPPVTNLTLIRKPIMEFIRRYFLKLGFLDGRIGLIQSLYQGYSVFITYAKLYEKQKITHR